MTKHLLALLLTAGLLATTGCDDGSKSEDPPPDPREVQVEVQFRDSSVPPEYHRSWTLALDQDTVHLVVDSYGDVIADESVEMPAKLWEDFVADLPGAEVREPERIDGGCDGGTAITLDIDDAGGADTHTEVESCGGDNREIAEDIEALVKPFTELVDLDRHTRT